MQPVNLDLAHLNKKHMKSMLHKVCAPKAARDICVFGR
jgi:hypothetical protein